jgi:hypothetical protein
LSTDDTLNIIVSGTYYYQITDSNGCTALSDSVLATVHSLPIVSLGSDTSICVFDSALTIVGTPTGGTISGNGLSGNMFYSDSAGIGVHFLNYEYSDSNSCTNSASINVTVDSCVVMMATVDSQSSGINVCQQDSIVLFVAATGAQPISYQWLFNNIPLLGETNDTLVLVGVTGSDAGSYNCVVSNFINIDTSATMPVIVNTNPILNTLGPDITLCEGDSWTLFADVGTYSYDWNNGLGSTDSLVVSLSAFYYYSVIDANGCTDQSDTIEVIVHSLPVVSVGNDTSFCVTTNVFVLVGSPSGGIFNGVGVVDSVFDPALSGNGTFVITYQYVDSAGCMNSDSLTVLVDSCLGLQPQMYPSIFFNCYPNPANNEIHFISSYNEGLVRLFDLLGLLVIEKRLDLGVSIIDISELKSGLYNAVLFTEGNRLVKRIIVMP